VNFLLYEIEMFSVLELTLLLHLLQCVERRLRRDGLQVKLIILSALIRLFDKFLKAGKINRSAYQRLYFGLATVLRILGNKGEHFALFTKAISRI